MEAPDVRRPWCCHPGGLVCQPVQACCHRGTEGRPAWLGGPVLQVVLDRPAAAEPLCPGAEAKRCRHLRDGAEQVSRQVPGEGWGERVALALRCLLLDVAESRDGLGFRPG